MSTALDGFRFILANLTPVARGEVDGILGGVRGRDDFGPRLKEWLDRNPQAFPEPVQHVFTEHRSDGGVDILSSGVRSGRHLGIQVKSDRDVGDKHFIQRLKAQIGSVLAEDLVEQYWIVLACRCTERNLDRVQHLQNQVRYWRSPRIRLMEPERAAALWRAMDEPLPLWSEVGARTWSSFFEAAGEPNLEMVYTSDWPNLTPAERFLPPDKFDEVNQSLASRTVTVIVGPPAVGKTFTALQLLWREFQRGREVAWLSPRPVPTTEGVLGGWHVPTDMAHHARLLAKRLGIQQQHQPIDPVEFAAVQLKADRTVFIEDPFGRTDEEFEHSLHTFDFFNLHDFINTIERHTARKGCRILITSREGLFERWLAELGRCGEVMPDLSVIRFGRDSYTDTGRLKFAQRLLVAREWSRPSALAHAIAPHVEFPFEIERIVLALPSGATQEQTEAQVRSHLEQLRESAEARIVARDDAAQLFLFLLVSLSANGSIGVDFLHWYKTLSEHLGMPGAEEALAGNLRRYSLFITKQEFRNYASQDTRFHLEPAHSTVSEVIVSYLSKEARSLLTRVAEVLSGVEQGFWQHLSRLALELIDLGADLSEWAAADSVAAVLARTQGLDLSDMETVFDRWLDLPQTFREALISHAASEPENELAPLLVLYCPIGEDAAWELLGAILTDRGLEVLTGEDPWEFLFDNLSRLPGPLASELDEMAAINPREFVGDLAKHLIPNWWELPESWRTAVLDETVLADESVQRQVLVAILKCNADLPPVLRELPMRQLTHPDYCIRTVAAKAIFANSGDQALLDSVSSRVLSDPESRVPLRVLASILSDAERGESFAESLLARADPAMAVAILGVLLEHRRIDGWRLSYSKRCVQHGGEVSQGLLACQRFMGCFYDQSLGYEPGTTWLGQSDPVRLGWLWAYLFTWCQRPALTPEEVVELVEGLNSPYRSWALYAMARRRRDLPQLVQQFLTRVEHSGGFDAEVCAAAGCPAEVQLTLFPSHCHYPIQWFLLHARGAPVTSFMTEEAELNWVPVSL